MTSRDYKKLFDQFRHLKVMVIGDVMVDAYLFGKVERISPEAPVPVVQVERRVNRLGGAANVALNIKSLGAHPVLCSVIGNDAKGHEFMQLLKEEGIPGNGILASTRRVTTTKFRILGNNTQMLRVDEEMTDDLDKADQTALLAQISQLLDSVRPDALIFQDYDKGVLTPAIISKVTAKANVLKIPVAVDPKKKNFLHYHNATLFKPNLKELRDGLRMDIQVDSIRDLEEAARIFHLDYKIPIVMTTLSDKGIFISSHLASGEMEQDIIPAHIRTIADVSGAGDTVISVAALCLACHLGSMEMAAISNLAGGLVCEEVGVIPINREKLLREVEALL